MNNVHNHSVGDLPDAFVLDQDLEIVGMTWLHRVATVIIHQTLDALIAPNGCCSGRGETEIQNLRRAGGLPGTKSGPRQKVGKKLFNLCAAMKSHAEWVLPYRVFCKCGSDFLWIELVPSLSFAGEHGANGRFVGCLLRECSLQCKNKNRDR